MKIIQNSTFLCLLAVSFVYGEGDFKDQFGNEFGDALKHYNAELLQSNLDGLKVFLETLVYDLDIRPRYKRIFETRLESVDKMKSTVGDSVTMNSVTAAKNFKKTAMLDILTFRTTSNLDRDPEKSQLFDKAFKNCAQDETKNVNTFIEKMQSKWSEMYDKIPTEELEEHPEYKDINDSIVNLSKTEGSFADTMEKITSFFNYTEFISVLLPS